MALYFQDEDGEALISKLKNYYNARKIKYNPAKPFVFVCGGDRKNVNSYREKFLHYSKTNLKDYAVFLAEDALSQLSTDGKYTYVNIVEFEEVIANLSDCVIIFPESPGSFAEVGYFSAKKEIRKNLLIVNHIDFQQDSFLNAGPFHLIDSHSDFRSIILLDFNSETLTFDHVRDRLNARIKHVKQNKSLGKKGFKEMDDKEKIFSILSVIEILNPINLKNLIYYLYPLFGGYEYSKRVNQYIAILLEGGFIERKNIDGQDFFFASAIGREQLIFEFDIAELRLEIMNKYHQLDIYELSEALK